MNNQTSTLDTFGYFWVHLSCNSSIWDIVYIFYLRSSSEKEWIYIHSWNVKHMIVFPWHNYIFLPKTIFSLVPSGIYMYLSVLGVTPVTSQDEWSWVVIQLPSPSISITAAPEQRSRVKRTSWEQHTNKDMMFIAFHANKCTPVVKCSLVLCVKWEPSRWFPFLHYSASASHVSC